jgi:hypothetical protein
MVIDMLDDGLFDKILNVFVDILNSETKTENFRKISNLQSLYWFCLGAAGKENFSFNQFKEFVSMCVDEVKNTKPIEIEEALEEEERNGTKVGKNITKLMYGALDKMSSGMNVAGI